MTDALVTRLLGEVQALRTELRRISTAELRSTVTGLVSDVNALEADLAGLDHGDDLAGLADDDHTQYLNEARHDLDDHDALPEAAVTQHEAALTITESQISDLAHTTDHGVLTGLGDDDHPIYPKGVLGYAEVTSGETGISSETDLTGLSVTVDVVADRLVRVTGHVSMRQQTSAGTIVGRIKESTTNLGRFASQTAAASDFVLGHGAVVLDSPSAGSHTYKLALQTTAGTVDTLADSFSTQGAAWILVEDLGPA